VNEFENLETERAMQGLSAFMRDMLELPRSAVTKITVEREAGP
jgi:hypothetical protein